MHTEYRRLIVGILLTSLLVVGSTDCSKSSKASGDAKGQTQQSREAKEATGDRGSAALVMLRVHEPNERAFTFLLPKSWLVEGGITRVNPLTAGGPMNAIAAKLDITVKRDHEGTVMIHWLPDMMYFDARMSPAGQMGLFPPGSNYQGMFVWPLLSAQEYLSQKVLRDLHGTQSGVKIVEKKSLPAISRGYRQRVAKLMPGMTFSYDAATMTVSYTQRGIKYKERLFTVIENWGELGQGMWGNKETVVFRAPENEFDKLAPIVSMIQNSVRVNSEWLAGELRGQAQRGEIVAKTNAEIQRIDREITEHRRRTNEEINNDMFLTLTGQEEYVNPYTNEVERGTNEYKHRWENASGEIVYSNEEYYDPNHDRKLNRTDFRRSPVRERSH
ncbi:MAG: hypothetical protein HY961_11570 [Ignavibacteriae bacterium]|nr:hypothetical protein [Ignavibacteriota bacterium]